MRHPILVSLCAAGIFGLSACESTTTEDVDRAFVGERQIAQVRPAARRALVEPFAALKGPAEFVAQDPVLGRGTERLVGEEAGDRRRRQEVRRKGGPTDQERRDQRLVVLGQARRVVHRPVGMRYMDGI